MESHDDVEDIKVMRVAVLTAAIIGIATSAWTGYVDQLASRLSVRRKHWSPDTIRRAKAVGAYWRGIRRQQHRTIEEVATALGVTVAVVGMMEDGIVPVEDMPTGYLVRLAIYLKRPDALEQYVLHYEKDYLTASSNSDEVGQAKPTPSSSH